LPIDIPPIQAGAPEYPRPKVSTNLGNVQRALPFSQLE
jgi:hypothetical protein